MRKGTVARLLESDEPSIRWQTRVHVLGENANGRALRALRGEIRDSRRVRALLSRRASLGRSGTRRQVYYKWQGLHWVLAALADLGYPEGDLTLVPIRDRVLELWTGPGYFREFEAKTEKEAYKGRGVPRMNGRYRRCGSQQGNALRAVLALGLADERADMLVERLLHWQWPDGGWNCDRKPEADTSSFNETLLPMLGLAAYARARKDRSAAGAADHAAEVFLRRRLLWRLSTGSVIHSDFAALHFPRYWHYDVLGGLRAMAEMGKIRDRRCKDALDFLEEKELPAGGWPAEKRYYKKVSAKHLVSTADYVGWGPTGRSRMNEWVTMDALGVLRAAGRLTA